MLSIYLAVLSLIHACAASSIPKIDGVRGVLSPSHLHQRLYTPSVSTAILDIEGRATLHNNKRQEATITEFPNDQIFYNAKVRINDRPFNLFVDTGSSITWVTSPDVVCHNTFTASPCKFTNHLPVPSSTESVGTLKAGYLDGSNATGALILSEFTLAGLTIPSQTIGVADQVYTLLSGTDTDGLLGLGGRGTVPFLPVFPSLMSLGLISRNMFSIALLGDAGYLTSDKGVLAFGGMPASVATASEMGTTNLVSELPYQILVDDFLFVGAAEVGATLPDGDDSWRKVLVDSGTYFSRLPAPIAEAIFGLMPGVGEPNAKCTGMKGEKCKDEQGYWKVPCEVGEAPVVEVVVGGVRLPFKRENLVVRFREDYCVSGIVSQAKGKTGILGVTFMKGVVVLHNYEGEKAVMGITVRK